jgi:hypothetical protein
MTIANQRSLRPRSRGAGVVPVPLDPEMSSCVSMAYEFPFYPEPLILSGMLLIIPAYLTVSNYGGLLHECTQGVA